MSVLSPHNLKYGLELQLQVKLFDIFSWASGEYQFRTDMKMPAEAISLEMSNAQVILEGIRRTHDRGRLDAALASSLRAVPRMVGDPTLRFQQADLEEVEQGFVASMDAMGRIYNITHRAPRAGGTDQRLSLTAAIDDYTRECAYATFDEKQKGTLAPGMLADVVVLATDVFSHEPTKREDIAVKTTILDGKVVYRARGD